MCVEVSRGDEEDRRPLSSDAANSPRPERRSQQGVLLIGTTVGEAARPRSPSSDARPLSKPICKAEVPSASAANPLAAEAYPPQLASAVAVRPLVSQVNCALSCDEGVSSRPTAEKNGVPTTGDSGGIEAVLSRAATTGRSTGDGSTHTEAATPGRGWADKLENANVAVRDDGRAEHAGAGVATPGKDARLNQACDVAATTDSDDDDQARLEVSPRETRGYGEASGAGAAEPVSAAHVSALMPALGVDVTPEGTVIAASELSPVVSDGSTAGEMELSAVVDDLFRGVTDDEPLPESWVRELARQRAEISANLRQQCEELREVHRRIQVTEVALQGMLYRMERVNEFTGQTLIAVVQAGESVDRQTQEMRRVEQAVQRTGAAFLQQQRKEAERLEKQNANAAHLLRLHRRVTDAHGWWLENQGSAVSALLSPYEGGSPHEAVKHVHWRKEVLEREGLPPDVRRGQPTASAERVSSSGEVGEAAKVPPEPVDPKASWRGPAVSFAPTRRVAVVTPPQTPKVASPVDRSGAAQGAPRKPVKRSSPGVGMDAYDGVSSLEDFLERFEAMAAADGWTDAQKAGRLPYYLPPHGVELVREIDADGVAAYAGMRQNLSRHYGEYASTRSLQIQTDYRVQARGEGLVPYARALLTLISRAYPTMDRGHRAAFAGRLFVLGLREPGLSKRVQSANPDSLEQAIAKALELQGNSVQETALEAWEREQRQRRARRLQLTEGVQAAQLNRSAKPVVSDGRRTTASPVTATPTRGILREPGDTDRHLYGTWMYVRSAASHQKGKACGESRSRVPESSGNGRWFGEAPQQGAGPMLAARR